MAIHYCGQPYNGPKPHENSFSSQATFMDKFCPELLAKTVFITKNSYSDVLVEQIKNKKDKYFEWKKNNPHTKPTEWIILVKGDIKTL